MIELDQLTKKYKKNHIIFSDTSISFSDNEIHFLLGANGSGKTTFFKCILNLEIYNGKINYANKDSMFCIFDDTPFYSYLSGIKNIFFFTQMFGVKKYNLNHIFLSQEKLKSRVKSYSYGQKKKLALEIVDVIRPKILLLDEVTNGMDYESIILLKQKLKEWKKDMTIIMAGHQLEVYDDLVDKVYIIENNNLRIVEKQEKKLGELYENYIQKPNF